MKKKEQEEHLLRNRKRGRREPPDDRIKPVPGENEEAPQLFRIMKRNFRKPQGRRDFLKIAAGTAAGLAVITNLLPAYAQCPCENDYIYDPNCTCEEQCICEGQCFCVGDACTCNPQCACDDVCTCDPVCSCEGVCTCDPVCICMAV